MNNYSAQIQFAFVGENSGGTSTIRFAAENRKDAVRSAWRWAIGRTHGLPEFFGAPLAIKVCTLRPQPISEDGALNSDNDGGFFDWKLDYGDIGLYIESIKEPARSA